MNKFSPGEVAERLKAHAWKVCLGQLNEGSNPSLSVYSLFQKGELQVETRDWGIDGLSDRSLNP